MEVTQIHGNSAIRASSASPVIVRAGAAEEQRRKAQRSACPTARHYTHQGA